MKSHFLRAAVIISAIALVIAPIQAHAKAAEDDQTTKLRQLRSELPVKIKEQTRQLRERVEDLESTIKKQPEMSSEITPAPQIKQETLKEETVPAKDASLQQAKELCSTNEARITTLIDSLNAERQQAFEQITHISDAAQEFYRVKNLQVTHYDQLVTAVLQAKTIAQTTKTTLKSSAVFSCEDSDLRASMQSYQEKRAASATGARVYRDSVKVLVTAVRDASKTSDIGTGK